MKIIRIAVDLEFPSDKIPTWDTSYFKSERLVCTYGTSNKEYIVRIYVYPDGKFSVIGWSGKIGGTLIPHLKYLGNSIGSAKNIFGTLVTAKLIKVYQQAPDDKRAPGKEMSKEDLVEFLDKKISQLIYKNKPETLIPTKLKDVKKSIPSQIKTEEVSKMLEPEMEVPESEKGYLELLSQKKNNWYKISKFQQK